MNLYKYYNNKETLLYWEQRQQLIEPIMSMFVNNTYDKIIIEHMDYNKIKLDALYKIHYTNLLSSLNL